MTKVWIDADACMGAGTCAQIVSDVFQARHDGTWAVKEESAHFGETFVFDGLAGAGHGPDGFDGKARIPESLVDLVAEAAEECPGECIFVEL
ncbi:MAG TPA: ferredoxin [Acidimicrobiia bacterium]|nr:ferredoxin [Acidimicrobiia bacterium]